MDINVDRRNLLRTTIGLAGAASMPAYAIHQPAVINLFIEAPDDVFVTNIAAENGRVKSGDLLFSLKSYKLLERRNHLSLLSEQIAISERPFLDGRVNEQIEMIKKKAVDFSTMNDAAQKVLEEERRQSEVLGNNQDSYRSAVVNALQTHSAYLDADLSAHQAERKQKDAQDKIQLAKSKLDFHEKVLGELEETMMVKSGANGIFRSLVVTGLFVRKGHILGTLEK